MEDDVLKLKEVVSVTFDTTPSLSDTCSILESSIYSLRLQNPGVWRHTMRQPDITTDGRMMTNRDAP